MCRIVGGFLLVIILCCVILYEGLRWASIREECETKRLYHHKLLVSDVCKSDLGESVELACAKASLALRTGVLHCVGSEWWKRGEIYYLYTRLTESFTALILIVLTPILYIIYKVFDMLQKKSIDDRTERLLQQFQQQQQYIPQIQYIPQVEHARRKSQFIYDPNADRAF
jgi:hypothetical protein